MCGDERMNEREMNDKFLKCFAFLNVRYNMKGVLLRTQHVGDGMLLTRGKDVVKIIFERYINYPNAIRVSVRRKDSSKTYDIPLEREVDIPEGRIFYKKLSGNRAKIGYIAPGFQMDRIEYYDGFVNDYVLLMEGERLHFTNGNSDFNLLVKKIWKYSALVEVGGIPGLEKSIVRYMRTGFIDGTEVGVSHGWETRKDKIMFHYYAKQDYSIRRVKS